MEGKRIGPPLSTVVTKILNSRGLRLTEGVQHSMEIHVGQDVTPLPLGLGAGDIHDLTVCPPGDLFEREAHTLALRAVDGPASSQRHDFGDVWIHVDDDASWSARELGARAYTAGNHLVFGEGQYAPENKEGQLLLAHELTHVLQQRRSGCVVIQCAEVGDTALPAGVKLIDLKTELNKKVNDAIKKARTAAKSEKNPKKKGFKVAQLVYDEIGTVHWVKKHLSLIEVWSNGLTKATTSTPGKIFDPSRSATRYAGVSFMSTGPLSPVTKVNGILVGTDKLGHFLQLGYYYFAKKHSEVTILEEHWGHDRSELGIFGLSSTGVYSNADLVANKAGEKFYEDLRKNPRMTFDIANYISEDWNEAKNPNYYADEIAKPVWKTVLSRRWSGEFTETRSTPATPVTTNLIVTGSKVTGDYDYVSATGSVVKGKIQNGTLTFKKSPAHKHAVTHVTIKYDWSQGADSGKGQWVSSNELALKGTWGVGTSHTNGGEWNLRR